MRILALDLSTHAGYAVLDGEMGGKEHKLVASGTIDFDKKLFDFGPYPHCYWKAAEYMADKIYRVIESLPLDALPDVVVIEEINSGRDRYVQKWLENIHTAVLKFFGEDSEDDFGKHKPLYEQDEIVYLNSDGDGGWRTNLGLKMTKEQKRANAKLSKAKRFAESTHTKLDKGALGIRGKVTKKHLAVAHANTTFNLQLKMKDNNEADAICIGLAYLNHATPCTGV
jgi:hypothetical protein